MGGLPIWLSTTLLGLGTVFIGLILLIYLTKAMSACCTNRKRKHEQTANEQETLTSGPWIAAVSAAIAQTMGADVGGIRILSIKKISD